MLSWYPHPRDTQCSGLNCFGAKNMQGIENICSGPGPRRSPPPSPPHPAWHAMRIRAHTDSNQTQTSVCRTRTLIRENGFNFKLSNSIEFATQML